MLLGVGEVQGPGADIIRIATGVKDVRRLLQQVGRHIASRPIRNAYRTQLRGCGLLRRLETPPGLRTASPLRGQGRGLLISRTIAQAAVFGSARPAAYRVPANQAGRARRQSPRSPAVSGWMACVHSESQRSPSPSARRHTPCSMSAGRLRRGRCAQTWLAASWAGVPHDTQYEWGGQTLPGVPAGIPGLQNNDGGGSQIPALRSAPVCIHERSAWHGTNPAAHSSSDAEHAPPCAEAATHRPEHTRTSPAAHGVENWRAGAARRKHPAASRQRPKIRTHNTRRSVIGTLGPAPDRLAPREVSAIATDCRSKSCQACSNARLSR